MCFRTESKEKMSKRKVESVIVETYESPLASFDMGNANSKVATADLKDEFRSILGRLSRARRFNVDKLPVFIYEGQAYVYSDAGRDYMDNEPISFNDMTRYTDVRYRRLFVAALWHSFNHLATDGVLYPIIVSSIPASLYAGNDQVEAVKANLTGPYEIDGLDGRTLHCVVHPNNLLIIPEGVGSYFQALYLDKRIAVSEAAILDVGFYTTDLIFHNKGVYIAGSARSTKHGVRQVAESVHRHLQAADDFQGDVPTVDNALESGSIQIANRCVNVTEQRDLAYAELADEIIAFYLANRGSRQPATVLLSGGGATGVFRALPEKLLNEGWRVVSGDPRRANVDGAFQFLQAREARKVANGQ